MLHLHGREARPRPACGLPPPVLPRVYTRLVPANLRVPDVQGAVPGAASSLAMARLPRFEAVAGKPHPLNIAHSYETAGPTYPYGCHIAEVEIDAATCAVALLRFTVVDDFGKVINPLLLEGQVHGGIAQGIGQALLEDAHYDENGQLLTASYMDYCMPRADDLPSFKVGYTNTPCTHNDLGVKGCGEAGAIASPPAIINAIIDALSPLGVTDMSMPATPQKVWKAIQDSQSIAAE